MSSSIPTACIQTESTVVPAPIATVWAKFRGFKLEAVAPGFVKSTEGDAAVGSIIKVTYKDGSVWEHQIIELSDKKHTIAYYVVKADPSITATSVEGEIVFERVSDGDQTFMKWTTEFSNGA
jgi:hypothetical protein